MFAVQDWEAVKSWVILGVDHRDDTLVSLAHDTHYLEHLDLQHRA